MKVGFGWKLHGDGRAPGPGVVVRPDERLSWGRTVGLGAQHVVAMFGATFVAPVLMGLDPNLAVMLSGVATVFFLLVTGVGFRRTWGRACRSWGWRRSSGRRVGTRRR